MLESGDSSTRTLIAAGDTEGGSRAACGFEFERPNDVGYNVGVQSFNRLVYLLYKLSFHLLNSYVEI